MARPPKDLNSDQIRKLASIQCTMKEIAAVMNCSVDTLERRFADIIKNGQEEGRMSLRRAQYQTAMKGNPSMLIWLGKQYLGQKETSSIDITPETSKSFGTIMNQLAQMQEDRKGQNRQITEESQNESGEKMSEQCS